MKYKIMALLSVIAAFAAVFFVQNYEPESNRYHQHLQARHYTPCTDHGEDAFCTHLPLISITTDEPVPDPYIRDENGERILQENGRHYLNNEMVAATIELFDAQTANNHLTDEPVLKERSLIRTRGNSSRDFDKKSYLLKFKEKDLVTAKDVTLAGMTADSSWVLNGPYMDRSLVRNYLCYNLAGEMMEYSPNVRFCEMFLNGEYMGLYLIIEKINYNKNGRVSLHPTNPKVTDTSYILKLDRGETEENHKLPTFCDFSGKRGAAGRSYEKFEIVYPDKTLTKKQWQKILYDISLMEKSITSFDMADDKKGYARYIDVDSFVDFFVLNEFAMNSDAGKRSTYYCKDVRSKIKIIGWDYNNTFNNFLNDMTGRQTFSIANTWYNFLLRDKKFVNQVVQRYRELRKTLFSDAYLYQYIDETIDYLGPAVQRNNKRWINSYTFDNLDMSAHENKDVIQKYATLKPLTRNVKNYDEAVEALKREIKQQGQFLDENISALYANCHDSVNKQYKLQEDRKK